MLGEGAAEVSLEKPTDAASLKVVWVDRWACLKMRYSRQVILEKPADAAAATAMLQSLSDSRHRKPSARLSFCCTPSTFISYFNGDKMGMSSK